MKRASASFSSSLGVVPDEISEWKPEIAPHAMVMKHEREDLSREHRTGAVDELRDRRHLQRRQHEDDAEPEREDDADLHERR
jgi:hypothetical protein